jgi:hypothetical protein
VFNSDNLRKRELECLRLASDCIQLADSDESPTLQQHFVRMATVWAAHADHDLGADTKTKTLDTLPSPQQTSRPRVATPQRKGHYRSQLRARDRSCLNALQISLCPADLFGLAICS